MNLKEKLTKNKLSIGSWVTIGHHSIVEIMASAGFDWLTIDMEHSAITLEKAQELILTIQSKKMTALVRVGKNDELIIKQVLDAGADGIIVPMVCSKSDAEKAVSAVQYPMKGKRGVGLARAQNYGIGFNEYGDWLKNESVIIAQIEHKSAVDNLRDIVNVDGIDGIIIGPYDLSGSLGMPGDFENQNFKDSIYQIETYCIKNNIPLGIHVINPDHDECVKRITEGYTFIAFSLDFYFLGEKSRNEMKLIKENIKK